jgi:hypothetical protein
MNTNNAYLAWEKEFMKSEEGKKMMSMTNKNKENNDKRKGIQSQAKAILRNALARPARPGAAERAAAEAASVKAQKNKMMANIFSGFNDGSSFRALQSGVYTKRRRSTRRRSTRRRRN